MNKIKISIFLICLNILFSCKHIEQFQTKTAIVKKDSLFLIKDTAVFGESTEGTEVKLFKQLNNNDSIIKVETFGEMGNVNYIFTFNKKLLNVVHITNHYQEPIYINSTPKILRKEKESLKESNKDRFTDLFYEYKSFFIKTESKKNKVLLSSKWCGKYSFTMNEDSDDWRDMRDISITINKDSVTYLAKGFQLYELYRIYAIEKNDSLKLTFEKDLNNANSWALKKTKNFGVITFDSKNYNWVSPYIDINFNDGKKNTYILKKE
ncbi:MAG: hypothetical protein REI96_05225 [Flavobacterium nitrogenifigens]|uniref:hypothetical protein n=1 Tax=Flavobacterium nitrogenifigens TaxID=1617283 RepID=UPI0028069DBE|nr:hypothetical protein [Flavobacterium nitrogenifigens]MDQ8011826.1 hypothetical protein [Flavobacterium nitrogenifigens]